MWFRRKYPPSGDLTFDFQTNGGPLTCFVPGPGGGPLPVKLSSFYARRNNNNVGLSWKTESEINSKEFVLERRTGNSFTTVATIAAANKSTGSSYSYSDNNLNKGVSLYRLKIIDLDGSFSYSSISAVRGTSSTADFTIFPNPSNGNAKVTISDISEPTDVQLLDLSGRVIKKISLTNTNTVNLNSLQKGMYMIRITNKTSGECSTQKLSVVN
ncbi:MAG: T9SS type A sorting domain-containing protein [Ferruginibacter sp.]